MALEIKTYKRKLEKSSLSGRDELMSIVGMGSSYSFTRYWNSSEEKIGDIVGTSSRGFIAIAEEKAISESRFYRGVNRFLTY